MSYWKSFNSRLSYKVMLVIIITLSLATAAALFFQVGIVQNMIIEQKVMRSQTLVRAIISDIKINGFSKKKLQNIIYNYGIETNIDHIFIVDDNYKVIASDNHNQDKVDKFYRNKDMRDAFSQQKTKWAIEEHLSSGKKVNRFDMAAPIYLNGKLVGAIEIQSTTSDLAAASYLLINRTILLGLVFILLLSLILGQLLSYLIISPLNSIIKGAKEVSSGNLDYQIKIKKRDEMGQVAADFNVMVSSLRRQRRVLKNIASRDSLTGLLNHRSFYNRLDKEIARAKRYNRRLSLCMADVDFFKNFNDTHGHLKGDKALIELANILKSTFRSSDLIGRLGGEEFGILLREQGPQEALEVAERLRKKIENFEFLSPRRDCRFLTVSLGIASYPDDAQTASGLSKLADKGLYQAKAAGRNRVYLIARDQEDKKVHPETKVS